MRSAILTLVSALCFSSCVMNGVESEASSEPSIASQEQAITAESSTAGYRPVPATRLSTGRLRSAWDGPMADLLAADALAQCWSALPESVRRPQTQTYVPSFARASTFADAMVTGLLSKMDSATCSTYRTQGFGPTTATSSVLEAWISARRDPTCSYELSSGQGLGIELAEQRDTMAHAPMPTGVPLAASQDALAEVAYADLYTCMAQKLVEHTQSSFVFIAPAEEVLRLYDWARNRSLLAVLQRSLLTRLLWKDPGTNFQPAQYGGAFVLRAWLASLPADRQTAMGQDLAVSVDTLVTLLNKQAEMLLRDASREGRRTTTGARARLLRALYGDNVLIPNDITQDMSGIEIGALLALSRASDALDLDLRTDNASGQVSVDVASSANRLLSVVERLARARNCAAGDTSAACAQVGAAERPDDFTVRKQFGIRPEHAQTMVRALAESLFGAPQDASASPWQWAPTLTSMSVSQPKVENLQSGRYHSCALYDNGSVACWGLNHLRQLGDGVATHDKCGTLDCSFTPVWVRLADGSPLTKVTSFAVGDYHACAAREDNSVLCWGDSVARGDSTGPTYATPVAGLPVTGWMPPRVFAGGRESCAIAGDPSAGWGSQDLYCWGEGAYGQLGDGTRGGSCSVDADCGPATTCSSGTCNNTTAYSARKLQVGNFMNTSFVAMSGHHVCVNGIYKTWCWGRDDAGQLGAVQGTAQSCVTGTACRTKPSEVRWTVPWSFSPPASFNNIVGLYAGGRRSCMLDGRGELKCWGELSEISTNVASDGSCGSVPCLRNPTAVEIANGVDLPAVLGVSVGATHACARGASGNYCWGTNGNGQFGNGTTVSQPRATDVGNADLRDITAGNAFSCAISTSDAAEIRCAGYNGYAQLGGALPANSSAFLRVPPPGPLPVVASPATSIDVVSRSIRRSRPGFILTGATLRDGSGGASVLHIAAGAAFGSYTGEELQLGAVLSQLPLAKPEFYQPLAAQGFMHRRFLPNSAGFSGGLSGFEWGGVQTLAVAREALRVALSNPSKAGAPLLASAMAALPLIDAAVGPRAVIVRQQLGQNFRACRPWSAGPRDTVDGLCVEPVPIRDTTRRPQLYSNIFSNQTESAALGFGKRVPHAIEQSLRPKASVFGAPPLWPSSSYAFTIDAARGMTTIDHTTDYDSSIFWERGQRPDSSYEPVFDGELPKTTLAQPYAFLTGAVATYGGSLNGLATQAFAFDRSDWSKPQYDAFGLPTDWVPTADPALTGSGGEEPYQYYLRLAKETATQATQAINDAFETTRQEETDTAVLEAANERAATLRKQETELLCGKATCAPLVWEKHKILEGIDTKCTTAESLGNALGCAFQMLALQWALSRDVYIPKVVWDQRTAQVPYFKDYAGGEMTQSLIGMWTALRRARVSAEATVLAINKGIAEYEVADAEVAAANAAVESARVAARQQYASMQAQIAQMDQQIDELSARRLAAQQTKDRACSDAAYEGAFESGKSYGDVWSMRRNGDSASWKYDNDNDSFSPGPLVAQRETCKRATYELTAANSTADKENLDRLEGALSGLKNAAGPSNPDKTAPVKEAVLRAKAASERVDVQVVSIREAFTNNLNLVLDALGAFGASVAELGRSQKRAEVASARYELDRKLDSKEVAVRQGLRRRYQGLSQWRATAMAENARRTAVAARRAIESRLVVNLSAMGTEEPFVAPPSAWADDVYERDLKPPAAVGVTVSSPQGNGDVQYASKLIDYVHNLELFVAGYSIKRPTAVARNDAEVVSVAGPASVVRTELGDAAFFFSDPDSSGWQLYCADTGTYVVNPLTNKFGSLDYNALRTACGGKPPSRAVIRFWLDPWGQLMGNPYSEPFNARYNTRWKQFAVNLVGTGIRDCASAAVPVDCYSEPFLRYDLKHVGPAVVTDYDMGWRSLKIPNAIVQHAKALAIEEWVDSVSRGWNVPDVQAVARGELLGRPMGGTYELSFELTPDVRLERIERVQVLTSVDYWTRQE